MGIEEMPKFLKQECKLGSQELRNKLKLENADNRNKLLDFNQNYLEIKWRSLSEYPKTGNTDFSFYFFANVNWKNQSRM
jgi:hypothetical protein